MIIIILIVQILWKTIKSLAY